MSRVLVAYFSRAGQNYVAGAIKDLSRGNTELLAEAIAHELNLESFKIVPAEPYPTDYYACTDVAKRELANNARPALADELATEKPYTVLILAYPNWWGTTPMVVRTFLDSLDLTGTTIAPLCTNEGSGLGSSARDLAQAYPEAHVADGLAIVGHEAAQSVERAVRWAQQFVE